MKQLSPLEMIKSETLKEQALTHRSFVQELKLEVDDFERLEFLGDALLDLFIAELLMQTFPKDSEGVLSKKRASLVNEEFLAQKSRALGFGQRLRLGPAEFKSGGADKDSVLANVFESLLAALYLDQGHDTARIWLNSLFENDVRALGGKEFEKDFKTRFQEWAQKELKLTPLYHLTEETGLSHQRVFQVEVRVGDEVWGQGQGPSKKKAEQRAAEQAFQLRVQSYSQDKSGEEKL
ncbi:MAG: ribonuclease III [Bdellovibrionales bacterium]